MTLVVTRPGGSPVEAGAPAPETSDFDPRRWINILRRRMRLFLAVAVIFVLLVALATLAMKPTYSATANLLIDPLKKDAVSTPNTTQVNLQQPDTNAIDTDVQVLSSRALAAHVIRKLNLDHDPEFLTKRSKSAPVGRSDDGGVSADVVDSFQKHVGIRRTGLTYLIGVSVTSHDAQKAALIANTMADLYISEQLNARYAQGDQTTTALGAHIDTLRNEVENSDRAVQQFKAAHNLLNADGYTLAEQEASALNTQIAQARAESAEKTARLNAARGQMNRGGGGADIGAALGSDTIRSLRAQEADASRTLADLKTRYGDRHPEVLKEESQLADIRTQIQNELNRIVSSLSADAQASNQRVASLEGSYGRSEGSLQSNNSAQVGLMELQRKADANRAIYEAFLNQQKDTSAQQGVLQPDARVVSRAQPPLKASFPNKGLAALFGIFGGGMLGLMAVAMAEFFSNGVESGADVERRFGVPYAGPIPLLRSTLKAGQKAKPPHDYIVDHPFSAFAESIRSLRTFLFVRGAGTPPRVIAITSALPREGKSMTAVCLARTMALAGSKVVLIDCDLRRRGASNLSPHGRSGLIEVLNGTATLKDALIQDGRSGAWMLPVLSAPQSAHDPFEGPKWDDLIAELLRHFAVIILDTPPVLAVADTRVLASKADATLMLTAWRKTPFRASDAAIDLLAESGANVVGLALSRLNMKEQARAGNGDRSSYYKHYKSYYTE